MKSIQEFLSYLSDLDIRLWSEGVSGAPPEEVRLRCNAPKDALTPALRAELADRKAEILAFLNNANLTGRSTLEPIRPVPRDGNIPLSFAQQGLWFLDQLEGGSAAYNQLFAVRLSGSLNVTVLEQAIAQIVRRHEVLRTSFKSVDGQPVQVIAPDANFTLSAIDLLHLPEGEQWAEVRQLAIGESQRPFNLAQGSLLRVALLQLGVSEHVLLFTIHHMVSDAWSSGIVIRELAAIYEDFSKDESRGCLQSLSFKEPQRHRELRGGKERGEMSGVFGFDRCLQVGSSFGHATLTRLPELSIQYADFAHWQRQRLRGEVFEEQLAYWKRQLGGTLPVLELPSDRPRPAIQTFRGATTTLKLGADLTQRLNKLSQQEGATLFMTLLASFQALLYRYTNQEDICVGTTVANRHSRELEALIGFFVNTLVLRTDLSGNPSFRELLGRVRHVAWEAYDRQDLPFDLLVAQLQPERNLSHTPLFQVMFVLENAPMDAVELPGLSFSLLDMPIATAKFDLTLSMRQTEQGLIGKFEYNTDLFDAATITRMAGHFETLLSAIAANPQQPLCDLPLLTEAERHQLLVEWNDNSVNLSPNPSPCRRGESGSPLSLQERGVRGDRSTLEGQYWAEYPLNQCIHQLFEAQVEQTPDAVAVVFNNEQLTYRELNKRANQVAHYLKTLGVKPEVLVGICVERSLEMLVGLLGILKAGGAYVPLDPAYPQERLAFMLSDSQTSVLLTQQQLLERLPKHQAHVVCLDTDWETISKNSKENPVSSATSDDLAYVIYTSGSTGKPKGVQIAHGAVVNLLKSMEREPGLTESDTLLAVTSISFDIAALELYLPLIAGGRLVLVSREVTTDGRQLGEQIADSGASVMQATPATWRMLLATGWQGTSQLKILCGGEALSRDLAEQLLEKGASLWNLYGPTETTIWSTACKVEANKLSKSLVPIGRPIANTQVYLLDSFGQPVPIGIPGELHIGGAGLARGYLNRPELTAEKFIPHPAGGRLYKTGDLARYLPDGTIEYIERIDHQVKLRGFRIELGEIEAVLRQHPTVEQAVVIAREDEPGNKRLVAYIVGQTSSEDITHELRSFLEKKLPSYMVPSAFVMLEALPLTPNGKVDRRALPAPDGVKLKSEGTFVSPSTPVEKVLAEIWTQVLGVENVGIDDNFFELGGDSFLSIQIIYKANQAGLQLTPKQLFDNQTIAKLAAVAGTLQTIQAEQELKTEQVASIQQSAETKSFTPSDFPQAQLNQKDLNKLLTKINRGSKKISK